MRSMMSVMNRIGSRVLKWVESLRGEFVVLRFWPRTADRVHLAEGRSPQNGSVAIILQGALLRENRFTLETVRTYRKLYPEATVIVSTWEGEDTEEIKSIEAA